MELIGVIILSYLLGAIPSAVWVSKIFYKKDVREFGSKNAGLTNIFRVLGVKASIPVAILDLGKGVLATYIGLSFTPSFMSPLNFALVCGLICILGHSFTCFAGFKGGKGVLTALGVFCVLIPYTALAVFIVWTTVVYFSGYVSLGSIIASVSLVALVFIEKSWSPENYGIYLMTLFVSFFVIYRHKSNITRLRNGTENRFGSRGKLKS